MYMIIDRSIPFTLHVNDQDQSKRSIWALNPASANGGALVSLSNKRSYIALIAVALLHGLVIFALLSAHKAIPVEQVPLTPMMVSLISTPAPEPEVVPLIPEPPKPQPVIKKQTVQPKPKDIKPTPVPVQEPSPVVEQTAMPTPPAPVAPVEVAKAPEIKPEPEKPQVKEDVIEEPKFGVAYLNNPAPNYPALSRRMGEQGRVIMRVLVSVNGEPESVKVENGSGSTRLDEAAVQAVKKWRFVPAKKNKQPISAYVLVPIKFSLDDA